MIKIPQEHIDWALSVEQQAKQKDLWNSYMECMNNKAMSERVEYQEVRDGCILSGVFQLCVLDD